MTEARSVTATFTLNTYVITPTVEITTSGTIVISGEKGSYAYGDVITLTAVPGFGWYFIEWTFDGESSRDNPITMTFRSDIVVNAIFGTRYLYLPLTFALGPMILTPEEPQAGN